jgi:hypothetical protein
VPALVERRAGAARQYAETKRDPAAGLDRPGYIAAKPAIVERLMGHARQWRG